MTNTLTAGKSKRARRRSVEAAGWVASIALSAVLGLSIHELASEPFTTTVDSPLALPKEFAVTSGDVEVPLPPVGQTEIPTTTVVPSTGEAAPSAPTNEAPAAAAGTPVANQPQTSTNGASTTPTTRAPGASTTPTTRAPSSPSVTSTPTTRPPSSNNNNGNNTPPATSTPTTQAPRTTTTINRLPPPVLSAPVETVENLVNGLVGQ